MANTAILYTSMYGHAYQYAQSVQEGIEKAGGSAQLLKAPITLPTQVQEMPGVAEAIEAQSDVPEATVEELPEYDGIILGSGTRFGNMNSQLGAFLDQCGPLWAEGKLVGKAAGFFTGASTMHGGHESTILSMSHFAYHQGMVIVPAGYAIAGNHTTRTGGSPYGPGYFAPQGDESKPGLVDEELQIGADYGAHFDAIASKLAA